MMTSARVFGWTPENSDGDLVDNRLHRSSTSSVVTAPNAESLQTPGSPTSTPPAADEADMPEHIPRPANAWMIFRGEWAKNNATGRKRTGKGRPGSMSTKASHTWHEFSDREKAVYYARAKDAAKKHAEKYPGWVYHPRRTQTSGTRRGSKRYTKKTAKKTAKSSSPPSKSAPTLSSSPSASCSTSSTTTPVPQTPTDSCSTEPATPEFASATSVRRSFSVPHTQSSAPGHTEQDTTSTDRASKRRSRSLTALTFPNAFQGFGASVSPSFMSYHNPSMDAGFENEWMPMHDGERYASAPLSMVASRSSLAGWDGSGNEYSPSMSTQAWSSQTYDYPSVQPYGSSSPPTPYSSNDYEPYPTYDSSITPYQAQALHQYETGLAQRSDTHIPSEQYFQYNKYSSESVSSSAFPFDSTIDIMPQDSSHFGRRY